MAVIFINDREFQTEEEVTLLELARQKGIEIPALCHHQALSPYGACRLCTVEVCKEDKSRLVTSCTYPVREEGISVYTDSPRVKQLRRVIVKLLLARCPQVKLIQDLAEEMGLEGSPFPLHDQEECILCGLCVRVCSEVIGKNAVSFSYRGAGRKVSTPFNEPSEECVGCTACAFVCPSGAIKVEDSDETRYMEFWNTKIPLRRCKECGITYTPENTPEYILGKLELPKNLLDLCEKCRRKAVAESLSNYDVTSRSVIIKE